MKNFIKDGIVLDFCEYCILLCKTRIFLDDSCANFSKMFLNKIESGKFKEIDFNNHYESYSFFKKSWDIIKNNNNMSACRIIYNYNMLIIYRYKNNLYNIQFKIENDYYNINNKFIYSPHF